MHSNKKGQQTLSLLAIRSPGPHGDVHPQTRDFHPKWRQRASSAGLPLPLSTFLHFVSEWMDLSSLLTPFSNLSLSRKCLITWKRREMQASSRVSQGWCSLAGALISTAKWIIERFRLVIACYDLTRDFFVFSPPVSWIWMHLRDRTKQKDLAWWQRRVQVSSHVSAYSTTCCFIQRSHHIFCCEREKQKTQGFDSFFSQLANAEPWQHSHYSVEVEKPDKIHSEFCFHTTTLLLPLQCLESLTLLASLSLSCLAVTREACVGFTCKLAVQRL